MKQEILNLLPPSFLWGESLSVLEETDSTNTYANRLAQQGAPHGTAVIAKRQTGGKGRMGRSFSSQTGGLYLTVILRPNCDPKALMHLTCAAGVAAAKAIGEVTGLSPRLKWINDLILENQKVGGILSQLAFTPDGQVDYALVGIGINCENPLPAELSHIATTLTLQAGKPISPAVLGAKLLVALYEMDKALLSNPKEIMDTYRKLCLTCGKEVLLLQGESTRPAKALAVTDEGGLLVELPDGTRKIIQSGEASVRGFMGYIS